MEDANWEQARLIFCVTLDEEKRVCETSRIERLQDNKNHLLLCFSSHILII
jgi:hypothetical protein